MLLTILVVVLILALIGGLPAWGFGWNTYGYGLSGLIGAILIILLIVWLVRGHGLF
jgi:hypothetical protein